MNAAPAGLVTIAYCDLGGVVRGRSVAAERLERIAATGLGWVPANQALMPLGGIAHDNPWGSTGDLRLMPDLATRTRVPADGRPPLDLVLGTLHELDGTPWAACPRAALRTAIEELEERTGLRLLVSFEHEFQFLEPLGDDAGAFSVAKQRRAEPFCAAAMEALAAAGLEPEIMIPEYGDGQFEVPCAPAPALTAADRSVLFKEVVRDVARGLGMAVTFAPLASEDAIGNGVHIHMSLQDRDSRPVTYDGDRPSGVSAVAEGFAHGILAHLPALSAFTAPSPISALRLRPGHWSASTPALGGADREAVLRVPGVAADPPAARAEQTNLELRAVDATACPHLALAAVVRAGMSGLDGGAGSVPGGRPIPASLDAALEALERDEVASGWFPAPLLDTYLCLKREELETVAEWTADERCEAYRRVF